ncbi:uncharacterized protein [Typha latifolia]|uniref:uncharacterized protein isoform X1 n=1 Tax=Typha latifolia TaxID=4733 RepID=UPI003C2AAFBC
MIGPFVTKTGQAITPLRLLRDNKDRLDEVISDVYVPDMEAFKLLDLLGLEGVFLIFGCAVDKELLKVAKSFPMFWREAHCWTSCLDKTCLALLVQTWEVDALFPYLYWTPLTFLTFGRIGSILTMIKGRRCPKILGISGCLQYSTILPKFAP